MELNSSEAGADPEILSTPWKEVSDQFWLIQQKDAVSYYNNKATIVDSLDEVPVAAVANLVEQELTDPRLRLSEESLHLLSLTAHMFIMELSLKSWHLKGAQTVLNQNNGPLGEISRGDVAFAVMHTEELDWMIDSVLPEYKEASRLVDPSQLHVGYFKAVEVLEADSSEPNELVQQLQDAIQNSSLDDVVDIWLKRDFDDKNDRVITRADCSVRIGDVVRLNSIPGRTIVLPDGTHGLRCVWEGGRLEFVFAGFEVILDLALPSLRAKLRCIPPHAADQLVASSKESSEFSESEEEKDDDDESAEESEDDEAE